MKIVVTGALGHIGSRVIRELPKAFSEPEIVMIDNMSAQRYCSLFNLPEHGKYHFIETDVLEADLEPITENADVVVHLAAITDATSSFGNKEQVEHVNYNATVRVAEACSRSGSCMIHLSSTSIYGTQQELVDENCSPEELKPQSPYAETKLKEEKFLQDLGDKGNLRFIICRFGTICGISPGMRFHTAVNKFCWQAVMGQSLTVWRTALHQKRPYLTLNEAVEAVKFIIKKDLFDQRIYNVLTKNLTVNSIIKFIKQHVAQVNIQYVDAEIMNQLSYEVSNLRLKKQGFEFMGSMEESIGETIKLLNKAGWKL
ncbi:MAG: NAD-dependent epimerase/dehydratase family protein [Desulfobacteraceae bacterium]|nr:NAD-dependent epimerase/dehydratase family protein [Desulfobacteraceae bacterium]